MPPALLEDVSHVIQLSIAPVFLLTAVGTFINVLSTRLARIVDRARVLRERQTQGDAAARAEVVSELHVLTSGRPRVWAPGRWAATILARAGAARSSKSAASRGPWRADATRRAARVIGNIARRPATLPVGGV
ncbi:MAG TPA: DUF2721 domain-containing protein [Polyangiaceae bacterium]|nr:DUF2721 domain-containing protein [Polyangiaceae bacterium]